jgi:hypothetical protein
MLDPLRSLAELVRTLTRPRTASARTGPKAPSAKPDNDPTADTVVAASSGVQALREKLRQRIRIVGTADRRRAREVFVETVLAADLGDRVTLDPAMADIVTRVAQQLGADANTDRDLGTLFEELNGDTG